MHARNQLAVFLAIDGQEFLNQEIPGGTDTGMQEAVNGIKHWVAMLKGDH